MFTRLDHNFAALLEPHFRLEDLEAHNATVFGLWPDYRLAYFNLAWVKFADANNGQPRIASNWGLDARYFDAIPRPLRPFYERLYAETPDAGAARHPSAHEYECSSPEVFRKFSMQVYALRERAGYIVINPLVLESPHDPQTHAPHDANIAEYAGESGIITQCSHCRLTKHAGEAVRWDWVPDWVRKSPPNASHTLCELCFNYYYVADPAWKHYPGLRALLSPVDPRNPNQ